MKNSLLHGLRDTASELLDIIFPRVCTVCRRALVRGEDVMCVGCMMDLPVTRQHLRQPNDIHTRLISLRSPIERCAAMFHYHRDSPYSRLIIAAKYRGRPSVGRKMAAMFAEELSGHGFFDGIDLIEPIPLHILKFLRRGYNQTTAIAEGLSKVSGIAIGNHLYAPRPHQSQTHKSADGRRLNAAGAFAVRRTEELKGKHILVVDDVITTGSTMVSALDTIKASQPDIKLSVLSLALTYS